MFVRFFVNLSLDNFRAITLWIFHLPLIWFTLSLVIKQTCLGHQEGAFKQTCLKALKTLKALRAPSPASMENNYNSSHNCSHKRTFELVYRMIHLVCNIWWRHNSKNNKDNQILKKVSERKMSGIFLWMIFKDFLKETDRFYTYILKILQFWINHFVMRSVELIFWDLSYFWKFEFLTPDWL